VTFLPLLSFLCCDVKRGFSPAAGGATTFGDLDLAIPHHPPAPSTPDGIREAADTLVHVDRRPGSRRNLLLRAVHYEHRTSLPMDMGHPIEPD
jgi:hypothetical protein